MEEAYVDAFCKHLRLLGLDATKVVFHKKMEQRIEFFGGVERVLGSIRLANRNIDLVELTSYVYSEMGEPSTWTNVTERRCNYVIHARVDGLESRLEAKVEPIRKGFLKREIAEVRWEGKELALLLNSDANLRDTLNRMKDTTLVRLEIKPYKKHRCVRIRQKGPRYPEIAFPTVEAYEAYDRIAQHIRRIIG